MRPFAITVLSAGVMAAFFGAGLILPRLVTETGATSTAAGAHCPAPSRPMARLELLFGAAKPDGTTVTEAEWLAFLDDAVTPRFPDGFTVLSGFGQWRNAQGRIVREPSRVLLVWNLPGPSVDADISAVRETYRRRFGQESVMRVDGQGCVAF